MPSLSQERLQLGDRKRHGRAINAVADFLRNRLSVPNVYLEPTTSILQHADILAIDQAGSGDIHIVEIKVSTPFVSSLIHLNAYIEHLKKVPAHYKYLVLPDIEKTKKMASQENLFAANGIGRVGILLLTEHPTDLPAVTLLAAPERFRIEGSLLEKIEKYVSNRRPDMEVRI